MLFKNRFRVESARLQGWDYGRVGCYFVTVCTKHHASFLGKVVDAQVVLSPIGELVAEEWQNTAEVRANVALDAWTVMPNHMHMIVVITHALADEGGRISAEYIHPQTKKASQTWRANTLGSIIGQFKGKCTKRIRAQGRTDFAWQSRFYDHIIRSEDSLNRIRAYIAANPLKWDVDRNNEPGLFM